MQSWSRINPGRFFRTFPEPNRSYSCASPQHAARPISTSPFMSIFSSFGGSDEKKHKHAGGGHAAPVAAGEAPANAGACRSYL